MTTQYILLIVLALFAMFFPVMEVAFVSANRLRIELDKKQDRIFSQIIELYMGNPAQYYSTIAIGNLLVIVSLAMLLTKFEFAGLSVISNVWLLLLAQAAVAFALYLLAGDILPKLIFRNEPNNLLKAISLPVFVFYYLFFLLSRLVFHISRLVSNIFADKKIQADDPIYWGFVDWDSLADEQVSATDADDESNDVKLFRNALDFSKVKLRECMVPRPEIVAISINDSLDELKKLFVNSGLSKIIVYKGSIDNVVGFAPSISMFQQPTSIAAITRNMPIVPESMSANKLLALFIQNHRSMALVVDEFGGTSGIVTMEDILEEIVGDIQDEYDKSVIASIDSTTNTINSRPGLRLTTSTTSMTLICRCRMNMKHWPGSFWHITEPYPKFKMWCRSGSSGSQFCVPPLQKSSWLTLLLASAAMSHTTRKFDVFGLKMLTLARLMLLSMPIRDKYCRCVMC